MSEYIIPALCCLLFFLMGNTVGFYFGKQYGADSQWVDDFLANARREQARRDKLGRFKERNT
jgi:hypothetical protein